MDGGDYSDGITKTPIVIDNVFIIAKYFRVRVLSRQALAEKKPLYAFLTHCKKKDNVFIPHSVGRPKHEKVMITTNEQDVYIGDNIVNY